MPDTAIDPLYSKVGDLLRQCGAIVGQPGSIMSAVSSDPMQSLRVLEERLPAAGLRPREVPARGCDQIRLTVLDEIDRAVSITISVDPLRRA